MPDWLFTVLFILLFILLLSILIVVHELGHLSAAKAFNVFCSEFSVGFGPAFFHKKRKKGETFLSFRAIPFGGYVAMLGEGVDIEELEKENGVKIDPKRNLNNIKKWKRAIIMVAGVTMNAILALFIFFSEQMFFTQQSFLGINVVEVVESSLASDAGISTLDKLAAVVDSRNSSYIIYDTFVNFYDSTSQELSSNNAVVVKGNAFTFKDREYTKNLQFFKTTQIEVEGVLVDVPDYSVPIDFSNSAYTNVDHIKINFRTFVKEGETVIYTDRPITAKVGIANDDSEKRVVQNIGLNVYLYEHNNNFGEAVVGTFRDFGNSATAVFKGIGALFTDANAWKNTSGIVGIGFTMASYLKNYGWRIFLYMWGLISVNLAIFNLFPFPGLDGWHLLVLAVEGIFHKEIPAKVKNIISAVGVILLMALMVLILFKDIFMLF